MLDTTTINSRLAEMRESPPEGECKFWLQPHIALASNRGVRATDLRRIEQLVFEHHAALEKAFYEYHP
jgi:hypothetical protein